MSKHRFNPSQPWSQYPLRPISFPFDPSTTSTRRKLCFTAPANLFHLVLPLSLPTRRSPPFPLSSLNAPTGASLSSVAVSSDITQLIQSMIRDYMMDMTLYFACRSDVRPRITPRGLADCLFNCGAVNFTPDGYVSCLRVTKDVTRAEYQGHLTFWGADAGDGPFSQRATLVWAWKLGPRPFPPRPYDPR